MTIKFWTVPKVWKTALGQSRKQAVHFSKKVHSRDAKKEVVNHSLQALGEKHLHERSYRLLKFKAEGRNSYLYSQKRTGIYFKKKFCLASETLASSEQQVLMTSTVHRENEIWTSLGIFPTSAFLRKNAKENKKMQSSIYRKSQT